MGNFAQNLRTGWYQKAPSPTGERPPTPGLNFAKAARSVIQFDTNWWAGRLGAGDVVHVAFM